MRSKILDNILIFFFIILLVGCTAGKDIEVKKDYILNTNNPNGLVLVHLSVDKILYLNWFNYLIRGINNEYKNAITAYNAYSSASNLSKYYEKNEKGRLALIELPGGDYEFYNWMAGASGWGSTSTMESTDTFSKKFTVTPGKIVYIGHLHTNVYETGEGNMYQKKLRYEVITRDSREQDMQLMKNEWKNIKAEDIAIRIME